jgi:hypothetical protein
MTRAWPTRPGFKCLGLSLAAAAGPTAALVRARLRLAPNRPALHGAAIGIAAGSLSWVLVDLWCPVAYLPHLLVGHLLPLIGLAALGAALGATLLSPRPRARN